MTWEAIEIIVKMSLRLLHFHDSCNTMYKITRRRKIMNATRLKALREGMGASEREMAALLCLEGSDYESYESGLKEPGIDVLTLLAEHFNVRVEYLLGISNCRCRVCKCKRIGVSCCA